MTQENTLEKEKNSALQENLDNIQKELNNYKKRFILQIAKEKTIKTDEQNYKNSIRVIIIKSLYILIIFLIKLKIIIKF